LEYSHGLHKNAAGLPASPYILAYIDMSDGPIAADLFKVESIDSTLQLEADVQSAWVTFCNGTSTWVAVDSIVDSTDQRFRLPDVEIGLQSYIFLTLNVTPRHCLTPLSSQFVTKLAVCVTLT
jgi:hypothetical protein